MIPEYANIYDEFVTIIYCYFQPTVADVVTLFLNYGGQLERLVDFQKVEHF